MESSIRFLSRTNSSRVKTEKRLRPKKSSSYLNKKQNTSNKRLMRENLPSHNRGSHVLLKLKSAY